MVEKFIYGGKIMGSFSWMRADKATKSSNFKYGAPYIIIIPKEFGGGFIKDTFGEFGKVFYGIENEADLYAILAYWNKCEGMEYRCHHYTGTETPAPRITAPRVLILDAMTRILLN